VCLNSLLYKTETDLQHMSEILGAKMTPGGAGPRGTEKESGPETVVGRGSRMFFDHNLDQHARSTYEYITPFIHYGRTRHSRTGRGGAQEHRIFERAGGLAMSNRDNGVQWDYPYGWAPTQWLAIEGLRRYGFQDDANRVSYKFLSTVAENFRRDGTIREKYNVETRSSESHIEAGYDQNVVGFGWTNGAFLALLHALPADWVNRLAEEQSRPSPATP